MSDIGEILAICIWEDDVTKEKCRRIRIDNSTNQWLSREEDPVKYDTLFKQYNDALKLGHTYCPEHDEDIRKKWLESIS